NRNNLAGQPLQLTVAQRTTIYRTIIPQGRGRRPIVRERIVTEPAVPAPVVRERLVTRPVDDYAYDYRYSDAYAYRYGDAYRYDDDYAYAPPAVPRRAIVPPASVYQDYAYAVGDRVAAT